MLLAVIAATEIGLGLLAPWPLKLVIDNVLGKEPMPHQIAGIARMLTGDSKPEMLFVVVIGGLLLQLGSQLMSTINTQLQVDTGQRMVYTLRGRLLAHLQALTLRHHILTRTADSVYRLEADAYCVHDLVMSGVFPLVTSVTTLAAMFAILYSRDRSLALLSLTVIPFLYACLRYYSKRMVDRAERVKELESKLVERLYEILSSIKVVKGFAREPHELQRFTSAGAETMSARLRFTWQESLFTLAVTAITLTGTALVLAVGGLHVLAGQLSVGELFVVTAYLAAVYGPLSSIAHTTGALQNAIASARRVREIFAQTPEMLDSPDAVDATAINGDIRFENVSFSYTDDRQILREISFSASPGEMVALVGLTGAGKSTLASLIPRFFEPTSGRVLIDGVDVSKYRLRSLRERIALVLQDAMLFGGSVADNIRYGRLDATDAEVQDAAKAAHAHDFIMRLPLGYETRIGESGLGLSGGQRQRIAIARALYLDPPILIFDEATSALDTESERAIQDNLGRVMAGRTAIVIAHRLSTIRDADSIVVLEQGEVAEVGTHDALMARRGLYFHLSSQQLDL